jgi:hypothetical protein
MDSLFGLYTDYWALTTRYSLSVLTVTDVHFGYKKVRGELRKRSDAIYEAALTLCRTNSDSPTRSPTLTSASITYTWNGRDRASRFP